MQEFSGIVLNKDGPVAIIEFNRPEKLNAMTFEMAFEEFPAAIDMVEHDAAVRAVIITGRGRGFTTGVDMKTGLSTPLKSPEPIKPRYIYIDVIHNLSKPTIAAVNGIAYGAGLAFALACDIRIASVNATFSLPFLTTVGLVPDSGVSYLLPRLVGIAKAFELLFTGDTLDAVEAERIGLVNKVVPAEKLMATVKDLAQRISNGPPIALAQTKRMLYRGLEHGFFDQLEYEAYQQRITRETEDFKEAISAFQEKRKPDFKGR